jgi:hypothetical protein
MGKMKPFPIKLGTRKGCQPSPLLFNIVLALLPKAIRQEEKIKRIQIGTEEVKLYLLVYNIIIYLKYPKNTTKNI